YLLVFESDLSTRVFQLPVNGSVVIGRSEDVALQLRDASVSRRHAKITQVDGRAQLSDLDSQNGTLVNQERIAKSQPLMSGDTIAIGAVTLVYHSNVSRDSARTLPSIERDDVRMLKVSDRDVVIADTAMARLYELIERLAATDLPVLVCGETGTGKEVAARALHELSKRNARPLVSLNCAAIQENLVESELFGYERGAFSGAVTAKAGLLETASGGTVFLDEIGDLPHVMQAKLLRVIETQRVLRLGDVRERTIDIRLVAATNRDLVEDVVSGRFRRDLYFRLSGATVWLPPLRDRPRELPILADMFLREACRKHERRPMQLSPATHQKLLAMPWPGNVRELKHLMEYLSAALADDIIEPHHLDQRPRTDRPPVEARDKAIQFRPLADEIRELEQSRISAALTAAAGNQRIAAQLLAMPLRTFVFKLKQYGLRRVDDR
ncbi:MAG TPA: sigma 54-interacting transcriptional regulator, partial [Kofleriaceae bacterium]